MLRRAPSTWVLLAALAGCALENPATLPTGANTSDLGAPRDAGDDAVTPVDAPTVGDLGAPIDTGPIDAGTVDAGPSDIGPTDTGVLDAGVIDTGVTDTGAADTGSLDASPPDVGPADVGPLDVGPPDVGPPDVGPPDVGGPPDVPVTPGCGAASQACCPSASPCRDGLVCDLFSSSPRCVPCGGDGQFCCPTREPCSVGRCNLLGGGRCTTCGLNGQPCCAGTCVLGFCLNNRCLGA